MYHWSWGAENLGWTGSSKALSLGGALRFVPGLNSISWRPIPLEPGSIGVRLAGISSSDGVHHRSGLNPTDDDSDDAWWESRAGLSNVLISNREGIAVLPGPEEAMSRMLLCPPIPMDTPGNKTLTTSGECFLNASALCRCEEVGPKGQEFLSKVSTHPPRHAIDCDCSGRAFDFAGIDPDRKAPFVILPTGTDDEAELLPITTFRQPDAGEECVVTLQLGANKLVVEYGLGLAGSLSYLTGVSEYVSNAVIGISIGVAIDTVLTWAGYRVYRRWQQQQPHEHRD